VIGCSAILAPSKAQPPAARAGRELLGAALLAFLLGLALVLAATGLVEDLLISSHSFDSESEHLARAGSTRPLRRRRRPRRAISE
jgi:hypothetical protein